MSGQRIQYAQWRDANEPTRYPFDESATLSNGQRMILEGAFLDATLHPVGGVAGMYLSQVTITNRDMTFHIAAPGAGELCHGSVPINPTVDHVALYDSLNRPAGLLVSEANRLSTFQSWGFGTHEFLPGQTTFAATVCCPVPDNGLRGVLLDDGTLLTGDVWLVGGDGVVLQHATNAQGQDVIRIHAVGDPLYVRRACADGESFTAPRFLQSVTFTDGTQSFTCRPDEHGDIKLTVGNHLAAETILRVRTTAGAIRIEAVGSSLQSVRG